MLFTLLFVKFEFNSCYSGLVVKEDDFYVYIAVSDNELKQIQNDTLLVDKESINYEIIRIGDEYVLTDSGLKREVLLKFEISENKKIVNNVLDLYFVHKKTFFELLKEKLK